MKIEELLLKSSIKIFFKENRCTINGFIFAYLENEAIKNAK